MKIKSSDNFAEKLALGALSFLIFVVAVALLGFAVKISIGWYTLLLPAAVLLGISFFTDRRQFQAYLLIFAVFSLWIFVCNFIYDWSYDGMYYHKQAVITLKEGWNPFRESSLDADVFASYPDMALWLDNYPKGIWIFSAAIYAATNLLETAKAVNILFLFLLFAVAYDTMRKVYGFSAKRSVGFALLITLNPVFLCQLFTSYNDLAVGSFIIATVLLCMQIYTEKANRNTYFLIFGIAAFSCTVKFTAPVFVGIMLLVTGICYGIKNRHRFNKLKKPVTVVIAGFLTGILLLGFDPYVQHMMQGKHLVYPVMGEGKYDIMNTNPPKTMNERNRFQQLFVSLFSKTNNSIADAPELKIPFSVHAEEWVHLSNADIRIGGFGVLFSGILILSLLLALIAACYKTKMRAVTAIFLAVFTLLTLFFPESWWARYTSYTYYIPVLILIYSVDCAQTWIGWLRRGIAVLMFVNCALCAVAVLTTGIQTTHELNDKLAELKASGKKIIVRVNDFPTHVKLFSEYGIDFEVSHTALENPTIFYRNTKIQYADEE